MSGSNHVFLLDAADLIAGDWFQGLDAFQGLSLFRTSSGQFFCDHGTGQTIAPSPVNMSAACLVLTLVGESFSYQNLQEFLQELHAGQSSLVAVKTLSISPFALEIYFDVGTQHVQDHNQNWQKWLQLAQEMQLDIGLKPARVSGARCRLACFDMDSTLIKAEVIDELAAEAGILGEVSQITERAMRGELDFKQSFTQRLKMLAGLAEDAVGKVLQRIQLMDGAEELFKFLNAQGIHTVILSGGFDVFAREVQRKLNISEVHANQLKFEQGSLTGLAIEPIMDAQRKQATLISLAKQHAIPIEQTLAVGDGANDLLMLAAAGIGVAFRAKPKVQAEARIAIRYGSLAVVPFFLGFSQFDVS